MATAASIRKRIERLERQQRARTAGRRGGGPLEVIEVYLSEPQEVRDARIAAEEKKQLEAGWRLPPGVETWFPGCGVGPMMIIVELDDVTEID